MAELISNNVNIATATPRGSAMLKHVAFVFLHVLPLLLASTAFTLITAPLGRSSFNWDYFAYTYKDGFGYIYHSDYSLFQVLTYLLAYASGLVLYPLLTRPSSFSVFAALICFAGGISFTVELSHWFSDHHLSLIVSFPIVLLPVALWTLISLGFHKSRPSAPRTCPPKGRP